MNRNVTSNDTTLRWHFYIAVASFLVWRDEQRTICPWFATIVLFILYSVLIFRDITSQFQDFSFSHTLIFIARTVLGSMNLLCIWTPCYWMVEFILRLFQFMHFVTFESVLGYSVEMHAVVGCSTLWFSRAVRSFAISRMLVATWTVYIMASCV